MVPSLAVFCLSFFLSSLPVRGPIDGWTKSADEKLPLRRVGMDQQGNREGDFSGLLAQDMNEARSKGRRGEGPPARLLGMGLM